MPSCLLTRLPKLLDARIGPHDARTGLPVWAWPIALIAAWVLVGLVGHDPWKADEAHTFGIVVDFCGAAIGLYLRWLASRSWRSRRCSTSCRRVPRISSVDCFLCTMAPDWRPVSSSALRYCFSDLPLANSTVATMLRRPSCYLSVALAPSAAAPDGHRCRPAGLMAGFYGLALARRTFWRASAALSAGASVAFLAKGLLGPGLLGLTALLLPVFASWRTKRYLAVLGVAASGAAIPAALDGRCTRAHRISFANGWLPITLIGSSASPHRTPYAAGLFTRTRCFGMHFRHCRFPG
jgi:hypothetical protein